MQGRYVDDQKDAWRHEPPARQRGIFVMNTTTVWVDGAIVLCFSYPGDYEENYADNDHQMNLKFNSSPFLLSVKNMLLLHL